MFSNVKDALTGTAAVTPIQFRRAQALARAHEHEWGDVDVIVNGGPDPRQSSPGTPKVLLTLPASKESVSEAIEAALVPHRSMPGIGFGVAHTTRTGRLSWEVHPSGAVDLDVRRPGATLCALRRLGDAAKTAWHGVGVEVRATLTALAGEGLDSGYQSADSLLVQELRRLDRGVSVLFASVGSDSSVEVTEKTRWDVASDEDAAEFRHWLTLRDALRSLGLDIPAASTLRPQVAAALVEYDAALASNTSLHARAEDARRLQADMLRDLAADDPTHASLATRVSVLEEAANTAEQRLQRAYAADVAPGAVWK